MLQDEPVAPPVVEARPDRPAVAEDDFVAQDAQFVGAALPAARERVLEDVAARVGEVAGDAREGGGGEDACERRRANEELSFSILGGSLMSGGHMAGILGGGEHHACLRVPKCC